MYQITNDKKRILGGLFFDQDKTTITITGDSPSVYMEQSKEYSFGKTSAGNATVQAQSSVNGTQTQTSSISFGKKVLGYAAPIVKHGAEQAVEEIVKNTF